jgi:hypothetical protein
MHTVTLLATELVQIPTPRSPKNGGKPMPWIISWPQILVLILGPGAFDTTAVALEMKKSLRGFWMRRGREQVIFWKA